MERHIDVYGEFYRKHMIDYLIKNNLEDELFLDKNGCFTKISYLKLDDDFIEPESGIYHADKLSKFSPFVYSQLKYYFIYEFVFLEEEDVLNNDINFMFSHYYKATESLYDGYIKYLENKGFSKDDIYQLPMKENDMFLYWMLKKDLYKDFLVNRQNNSKLGYNDYMCHTLFKDLECSEKIFSIEKQILDSKNSLGFLNKKKEDKNLVIKLFKEVMDESYKINTYNEDKNAKKNTNQMMEHFVQYEFACILKDSTGNQEFRKELRELQEDIFKLHHSIAIDMNFVSLHIDKKLMTEKSPIHVSLIDFFNLDENYCRVVCDNNGRVMTGFKQDLSTAFNVTFYLNENLKDKEGFINILYNEITDFLEDISTFNKFNNFEFADKNNTSFNQKIRTKYMEYLMENKEQSTQKRKKI